MPARFQAQSGANLVKSRQKVLPAFRHRHAFQQRRTPRDEPYRIARGMAVDAEEDMPHRVGQAAAPTATGVVASVGRVAAARSTIAITSARRAPVSA